jgi:oligoendopeptidase F
MWAVKPHYYNSHFYNWPYTFGLLFGLGLFAAFQTDPERFVAQFDDLLSRVGIETAEPLATEFGIDLTSDDFWRSSTEVLRRRIDRYVELARQ